MNLSLFAISGSAHEAELTFGVKPLSSTLLVHDYCRICFLSSLPFTLHHFDVVSLSFLRSRLHRQCPFFAAAN